MMLECVLPFKSNNVENTSGNTSTFSKNYIHVAKIMQVEHEQTKTESRGTLLRPVADILQYRTT